MRVAIVHYHLKRGGVTRVIESALAALESTGESVEVVVLAGEVPSDLPFRSKCFEISGLRYSNAQENTPEPAELAHTLESTAREALGGPPDVWHIHNHSLGKNSSFPSAVEMLARGGEGILLQMHDFAEDGRPDNHQLNLERGATLYPTGPRIHYACINGRDHAYFAASNLGDSPLHMLANAVDVSFEPEVAQSNHKILGALSCEELILYPVRAVRRKNFGELLLWAACAPEGTAFATTLGPTNLNFEDIYAHWMTLASDLNLEVHFGIGERYEWPFESIMQSASAILTTSIAEGFGLAFLEPWLFGKPIIGRDLPAITEDFKANGITFDGLYDKLRVPCEWIDTAKLQEKIETQLHKSYQTYGIKLPDNATSAALEGIASGDGYYDFGGLDESMQTSVIQRVREDPSSKEMIQKQLPLLRDVDSGVVRANAKLVREQFSLENYGRRLHSIYERIRSSKRSKLSSVEQRNILDLFLRPEAFRLLRT